MSRTEPGVDDFEAEASAPGSQVPVELWSLLKTISNQIDEADQRHTGLLQELRDRLAALSRDAQDARASVPAAAAPAYERIEHGLAELAHRIDALDDSAPVPPGSGAAPAALKSAFAATGRAADERTHSEGAAIDPFDVVGDEDPPPATWSAADAEALTRLYEESDAALVRTTPRTDAAASDSNLDSERDRATDTAAADPLNIFSAAPQPQPGSAGGVDREWLDQRLADIAQRIEQSLFDLRSDLSVDTLGLRFDAFEERMGSVLGDVATRTDVESLRLVEGQIRDLAAHLEQTELQLGRLDGIEQQLQALIDHLSTELANTPHAVENAAAMPDLRSLAHSTAEEVAQRLAAQVGPAGSDQRLDELGALLRGMVQDRRQSDEQTYAMLDTVQQAMIRLLDRIDALELQQIHAQSTAPADPAPPPPPFTAGPVPGVQDFGAPDPYQQPPVIPAAGFATAAEHRVPPVPAGAPVPASGGGTPVDRLRQDFIADAQRAKMRAAAAAEPDPAMAAAAAAPRVPRSQGPRIPAPASGPDAVAGRPSRKQWLTALALGLLIAVSGAALLVKSRNKVPAAPAAVTETMPKAAAPDAMPPASDGAEAEAPVIDVPAAPKGALQPSTQEGAAFEAPADEAQPVPVPAPNAGSAPAAPEALAPPKANEGAGAGEPQTKDGVLEFESETPSDGEVIENRSEEPPTQGRRLTPQGIILQDEGRKPSAQELVQLHSQQNVATLSSRLGSDAARLTPADLMPDEVARQTVTSIAAAGDDVTAVKAIPASVSTAAMPGPGFERPVSEGSKTFSQLSLPPATVGPLSLRLAAANGDPSAAFEVGARLAEGKGTSQNFHEAIIWYQKSASQGFAQAQYRLGTLYERGLGVKADLARAQMWYQRAAEQGHVKAMHNLAVLSIGRQSGNLDYATAGQWFESAAQFGLADSQYNLAVLYESGLGVGKDAVLAFKWFSLAARGGDAEALRRRDALKAQLSTEQRRDAEAQLAAFRPKRSEPLVNDARVAGEDWKKRQEG